MTAKKPGRSGRRVWAFIYKGDFREKGISPTHNGQKTQEVTQRYAENTGGIRAD